MTAINIQHLPEVRIDHLKPLIRVHCWLFAYAWWTQKSRGEGHIAVNPVIRSFLVLFPNYLTTVNN